MSTHKGFTVIELIVVIALIGVLLVIGVVSFRSTQSSSRDKERQLDIKTITTYLEGIYAREIKSGSVVVKAAGSYPSRATLTNQTYYQAVFGDLYRSAVYSPDSSTDLALIASTNSTSTTGINESNLSPSPTKDKYVYLPLLSDGGAVCGAVTQECRSFQIYAKLESGTVEVLESKHK